VIAKPGLAGCHLVAQEVADRQQVDRLELRPSILTEGLGRPKRISAACFRTAAWRGDDHRCRSQRRMSSAGGLDRRLLFGW
jgi:hypothetical protein